ncbi:hypothetical protein DACRYDRAFT_24568 [Dacryopinax primogenitus]|uniref:Uncharacterized protein n=1 Tax=Dacryopinax primogenitus (strain DJM 731) TaxID=1858805 RepID=M5FS83_DACPD|nr:uncharacterized protein DACRYDRAFT_24568 [Dacryopinax primogenitus]EJT98019.1 hypothetical protein DACRYDRAFT_24568 [Dacryopinax primogenitus]
MINLPIALVALAASTNAQRYYNNGYNNYGMSRGARIGLGIGIAVAFLIFLCLLISCCMSIRRRRAATPGLGIGAPAMGTVGGPGYGPAYGPGIGGGKRFGFGQGRFGRGGIAKPANTYQPAVGAYAPVSLSGIVGKH